MHEAALYAGAGPCPPTGFLDATEAVAYQHVRRGDPGEQRGVLVRRLPHAPLPCDDLSGQAVYDNQQASAAFQVRAIRHDHMPGGGVGFQHGAQAPAPGGPLAERARPGRLRRWREQPAEELRQLGASAPGQVMYRARRPGTRAHPALASEPVMAVLLHPRPAQSALRGPVRSCPHRPMKTQEPSPTPRHAYGHNACGDYKQ